MPKHWKVLDDERGIWFHEYPFAKNATANCAAIKLRDGEVAVLSPPCRTDDEVFREIEELGQPVALVASNGFHYLGQSEWQERYPDARAFAHPVAAKRIMKKEPSLRELEPLESMGDLLPSDAWVGIPAGMKHGDVVAHVELGDGSFWYFNDLVMNMDKLPQFPLGLLFKLTKSGPGFAVTRLIVKLIVSDKPAFKRWFSKELAEHEPSLVLTGHGAPITDPTVAATLPRMIEAAV